MKRLILLLLLGGVTLVLGGAEDSLPGSSAERLLLPGLGHVPHMEAPERTLPPLVAFLKERI